MWSYLPNYGDYFIDRNSSLVALQFLYAILVSNLLLWAYKRRASAPYVGAYLKDLPGPTECAHPRRAMVVCASCGDFIKSPPPLVPPSDKVE